MSDKEYLSSQSNKEILASIFLGILRFVPIKETTRTDLYEIELQHKLKFKHIEDPKLLRGCIDLLEDTECAIQDYREYGLGDSRRLNEKYLRLYGILNSIYQQIFVIVELIELFNFPGKMDFIQETKKLQVFGLRNKIAAHTINFQIDLGKKPAKDNLDFFRLAQTTLTGWGEGLLVVSNKNDSSVVNLKALIAEYEEYSDKILLAVGSKAVNSIFANNGEHKDWLLYRLEILNCRIR